MNIPDARYHDPQSVLTSPSFPPDAQTVSSSVQKLFVLHTDRDKIHKEVVTNSNDNRSSKCHFVP